jgi:hypothetical protein
LFKFSESRKTLSQFWQVYFLGVKSFTLLGLVDFLGECKPCFGVDMYFRSGLGVGVDIRTKAEAKYRGLSTPLRSVEMTCFFAAAKTKAGPALREDDSFIFLLRLPK